MKRTTRGLALGFWLAAALGAQQGSSSMPGTYSGPSVLSRWSRLPGTAPRGPVLSGYLHGSYAYMDGLVGPVEQAEAQSQSRRAGGHSNNLFGGGGLSLGRVNSRGSLQLSYGANYSKSYSRTADAFNGINQDANLMYERQLSRRWGFYTGHTAGSQSSILGLARPTDQRNFFDPAYSTVNEALDARLRSFSSGVGFYFQKSNRLTGSFDGGGFAVSRTSSALVSSRGERAQGEIAYRLNRNQSIGAYYSFSHYYFPRGFGETYVHSIMLSYTRQLNRIWSMQLAAGPYRADSERLRSVAVDPFIAALTGNATTVEVFQGKSQGIGVNSSLAGVYRRQNVHASYRRSVEAGNGVTLSSLGDNAQITYGFQTTRRLGLSASVFFSRLVPMLTGLERNATFQSYGGQFNANYRLNDQFHIISNFGVQNISYQALGINQPRRVGLIGLAYSPGVLPLIR